MEVELNRILALQRAAQRADGPPSAALRRERLDRLASVVLAHADEIVDTLSRDFGGRSTHSTRIGDVIGAVAAIRLNRDSLEAWMQPEPIALPEPVMQLGARAELRYQPLGVVGAIVPWNGPVLMGVLAAAGAIAAGDRLMLKAPELTPLASALMARMFAQAFQPEEVQVIEGDAEVAATFSRLSFDHLLFTGSTATGRLVARAAAENLVPVTLELGGRNPVIVGRGADIEATAARIVAGKMASAGQVCVSPDYVLAPRAMLPVLRDAMARQAAQLYPRLLGNDDYTAIVSDRHFARLKELLEDAKHQGATVLEVNPAGEDLWGSTERKFPLCLLTEVRPTMRLMQEESFGPLLSLLPYDTLDEAIAIVADQPAALSGYYFGPDERARERVLAEVAVGNMVVNDVRCQLFFEQMPFGGCGPSGMGRYRGHAGFKTFSNAKAIVYQAGDDTVLARQRPPFSDAARAAVLAQIDALKSEFSRP